MPGRNLIWMLNPQSNSKRRMVGQRLTARRGPAEEFSDEAIKEKLRTIRRQSAAQIEDLVKQLTRTCQEQVGVDLFPADTAQSAAQYLADIAGPQKRVAVNRSACVGEIRPALLEQGFTVIDSYDQEFEHPQEGARYYWEVAPPEPEVGWESFDRPKPAPRPQAQPRGGIALVGVNTISAADGTVFFVEHLSNISRLLREAQKVVLLVGLDKIAPTAEEARFVAQATALFGAPTIAMTASSRGHTGSTATEDETPLAPSGGQQELYIILLDNQRRWLLNSSFHSLFTCIGCRACLRECPTFPYLGEEPGLSPRDQLWKALRGDGDSTADCVSCGRCKTLCPVDIDLPLLLSEVKGQHPKLKDQFFKRIDLLFAASSQVAPVANLALSLPLVRYPAQWVAGLDRRRELPHFHQRTFARWAAARSDQPAGERKVVYYYGCYVNYTDPSLGRIAVSLLERNGCEVAIPPQTCCGVAAFWHGDRKIARQYAWQTIQTLMPWVNKGYQVMVTCPSCGLALTQDFLTMFPDDKDTRRLAEHTSDATTFILDMAAQGAWTAPDTPVNLKVGYHTPCHLRIRDKGPDSLAVLSTIPGLEVANMDRGCCGLAGSYGMKARNYDKSMAVGGNIAEFLQEGQFDAGTTDCAGCEMQIHAVSGLPVYHPLKLLWQGYGESLEELA